MVYSETLEIVRRAEDLLLSGQSTAVALQGDFKRNAVYPFWLLSRGLRHGVLRDYTKWALIALALVVAFSVFVRLLVAILGLQVPPELRLFSEQLGVLGFYLIITISALIAVFPVPSVFSSGGVRSEDVREVAMWIRASSLPAGWITEAKTILDSMDKRAEQRLTALNWSVALAWAVTTYYLVKYVEAGGGIFTPGTPDVAGALRVVLWGMGTAAWFVVVNAYERATRIVLRTVQFGPAPV